MSQFVHSRSKVDMALVSLHAGGALLDADRFLAEFDLSSDVVVHRRGDRTSRGRVLDETWIVVELGELSEDWREVTGFIQANARALDRLRSDGHECFLRVRNGVGSNEAIAWFLHVPQSVLRLLTEHEVELNVFSYSVAESSTDQVAGNEQT